MLLVRICTMCEYLMCAVKNELAFNKLRACLWAWVCVCVVWDGLEYVCSGTVHA